MKYYVISRYRNFLDEDYVRREVERGAVPYDSFKDADNALSHSIPDDSDYAVCVYDGTHWCYVSDSGIAIPFKR